MFFLIFWSAGFPFNRRLHHFMSAMESLQAIAEVFSNGYIIILTVNNVTQFAHPDSHSLAIVVDCCVHLQQVSIDLFLKTSGRILDRNKPEVFSVKCVF